MKVEKWTSVRWIIFMCIALTFLPGMVTQKSTGFFRGTIEAVDKDFKFIMVNGVKVSISSTTQISNEKGKLLTVSDLRPNLSVIIDGSKNNQDLLAKRILVKGLKNSKP